VAGNSRARTPGASPSGRLRTQLLNLKVSGVTASCLRLQASLRTSHKLILIGIAISTGAMLMPIFEYICQQCEHEFETLVFGRDKAKCPKCQSQKLSPQLSVFATSTKGSSAKSSANASAGAGACGSCGDPRGPGSCSLGDLD